MMNYFDMLKERLEPVLKGKELTLETSFRDLGIDSLDLVDLVFELEDELGIQFEDDELANLNTVESLIRLVESKK